jgi:hypothetical protein
MPLRREDGSLMLREGPFLLREDEMADGKISGDSAATTLVGVEYAGIQGGANVRVPQTLLDSDLRNAIDAPIYVATRTALKALDTTKDTVAILTEAGREGTFIWRSGDYSTQIAADTAEGIYVKADAVASTVGAWVRQGDWFTKGVSPEWFGAAGDNSTDDSAAFNAMSGLSAVQYVRLGGATYYLGNTAWTITNKAFTIEGAGINLSRLRWDGSSGGISVEQDSHLYRFALQGVSLLQSASDSGTALTVDGTGQRASSGTGVISNRTTDRLLIRDVETRGATGPDTNGWHKNVSLPGVMHGIIDGLHVIGQYQTTGDNILSASGVELTTDTAASAAEFIIVNSWIFHTDIGVNVGEVEGVQITKTTMVGVNTGVYGGVTASGNPHLSVIDNHFNVYVSAVDVQHRYQLFILDNLFYGRNGGATAQILIRVRGESYYNHIERNTLVKTSSVTFTGIKVGESATVNETVIRGNLFQGGDTAIDIGANSIAAHVSLNVYVSVTTELNDAGTATFRRLDGDNNPLLMVNGTVGAPAFSFQSDPDTGLYRIGANSLGLSVGGSEIVRADANGLGIGLAASPSARLHVRQVTASTNTALQPLRVTRETSGTPGAGITVGIAYEVETSAGNNEVGLLTEAVPTTLTAGAEDFDYVVSLMRSGAAAAEKFRVKATGEPVFRPPSSTAALGTNGEVTIEFTNNTTLTFKARGSDGTTRSATLTLS